MNCIHIEIGIGIEIEMPWERYTKNDGITESP